MGAKFFLRCWFKVVFLTAMEDLRDCPRLASWLGLMVRRVAVDSASGSDPGSDTSVVSSSVKYNFS